MAEIRKLSYAMLDGTLRGECASTTLKTWKILTKLRCCPAAIVKSILVPHHVEHPTYRG